MSRETMHYMDILTPHLQWCRLEFTRSATTIYQKSLSCVELLQKLLKQKKQQYKSNDEDDSTEEEDDLIED